jgi:HlyD family secretion protein
MVNLGKSRGALIVGAVAVVFGVVVAFNCDAVASWLTGSKRPATIMLSGNIEAHQAVLGFKTVQSRIVELPFNEGQWVTAGTLLSRVDDSDYRQQVAIAAATLEVQTRQLAAAEQNLAAAHKIVESDAADLELAKLEFDRADQLMKKGAGTIEARDQRDAEKVERRL